MTTSLKRYNFHIQLPQLAALQAIERRDGVPVAEQIRRAIDLWLETKKPATKSAKRR